MQANVLVGATWRRLHRFIVIVLGKTYTDILDVLEIWLQGIVAAFAGIVKKMAEE